MSLNTIEILIDPEIAFNPEILESYLRKNVNDAFSSYKIEKRSFDLRKGVKVWLRIHFLKNAELDKTPKYTPNLRDVSKSIEVTIVGAGPAGLFAALQLIELGLKPVIFERGKEVRERRRDLANITKKGIVNPDSNYAFGEGGAGTYSDGKLFTRSNKRGDVNKILEIFHFFGASDSILIDSHPHIGTNLLPKIIENIREFIKSCGGEIHFNKKVTDIGFQNNQIKNLVLNGNENYKTNSIILATGHSARDIFDLLNNHSIYIEYKPFSLGVRWEHPQETINRIQYKKNALNSILPPASYSLVTQVDNCGVYTFCMCPGGIIAPCATDVNEIVTNGWSPSKRNNKYANSGVVVQVLEEDLKPYKKYGALAGVHFQKTIEQNAYLYSEGVQKAPAVKLIDYLNGKISNNLPNSSYLPGIVPADMDEVLTHRISNTLRQGMKFFTKQNPLFLHPEAVVVAPETRTSSPVRIPRNKQTYMHEGLSGLFPCSEGAGYAGGIVSAAIDGQNVAQSVHEFINRL